MKLVFAGTPEAAIPSLQLLCESEHEVVAVLTQPPAPAGRGRKLIESPVALFAQSRGIEVLDPVRVSEAAELLEQLKPDCIPVVAYGQLVPQELLGVPRYGWVNLHFSLLPSWRGAAPVQHAIWAGDHITGATTFILDSGMDTGPVLGSMTEVIRPDDTAGDLLARLADAGAILLRQSIDALALGKLQPQPQGSADVSYAPKITKSDAQIDWGMPALEIDRRIRATTPNPGAWSIVGPAGAEGSHIGVEPIRQLNDLEPMAVGAIKVERKRILVGTGTHPVELIRVKPAGKKTMLATDWVRGLTFDPVFTW